MLHLPCVFGDTTEYGAKETEQNSETTCLLLVTQKWNAKCLDKFGNDERALLILNNVLKLKILVKGDKAGCRFLRVRVIFANCISSGRSVHPNDWAVPASHHQ